MAGLTWDCMPQRQELSESLAPWWDAPDAPVSTRMRTRTRRLASSARTVPWKQSGSTARTARVSPTLILTAGRSMRHRPP